MSIAEDAISGSLTLIERWVHYRSLKDDARTLIRLCAIECRRNLALLSALRLDDHTDQSEPGLAQVAKLLETDGLESLFAIGAKETKAYAMLSERVGSKDEAEKDDADLPAELLLRIYVRTTAMRKLAMLEPGNKALRDLRWRTRLKNLAMDLRHATKALDETLTFNKGRP